jgi:hypothetical protein
MSNDVVLSIPTGEMAPSVRALLAEFHGDTLAKLELAPVDSQPTAHLADGTLCAVDASGWLETYDNLDKTEAIPVQPTSVRDSETW